MKALFETRPIKVSLLIAAAASVLVLAGGGVAGAAPPAVGSALNQLQAAQAVAAQMQQNPPAVADGTPHAKDLNEASRQFAAWQAEMFRQRDELAKKQARLLHDRMKVPPPLPPSEPDTGPAMTRLDLPLPFFPADVSLNLSLGEPTISLSIGAEGKALSCVGASYKVEAAYAAAENRWTIEDPLEIKASFGSDDIEAAGSYQFLGSVWTGSAEKEADPKKVAGAEVSVDFLQVSATVGYNNQRELSLTAGYDLLETPKKFSKVFEGSVGLEASVSAPVVVHGLTRSGKLGLPTVLAGYSAKVVKLLTEPRACPYCVAQGNLNCPTCKNARSVTCPDCGGKGRHTCPKPKCYGGKVPCSNCQDSGKERCGHCGGKGRLRCSYCRGSGQVTVWEEETGTRERTVSLPGGFDSAGQPIYIQSTRTETYTERVPHREWCGGCDGSGLDGTCGTCSGTGKVTCHKCRGSGKTECRTCKGSGKVDCRKCRETGKIPCPTCRGKALVCPLCKGKKTLGQ